MGILEKREGTMARIKHIAIRTPDPEKTAAFYKEVFDLKEVGKAGRGYYLSDGYINLAILKSSDQGNGESPRDIPGYAGIDHLGFQVENVDETCKKLEEAGASATCLTPRPLARARITRSSTEDPTTRSSTSPRPAGWEPRASRKS
jgi:catechol 2,3-dioxygenase-like lactoylglutathione lyase family enzyme